MAWLETVRLILARAKHVRWAVYHLDIESVFLNSEIQEEVFVAQPERYVVKGQEQLVCKLKKTLYGLK